MKTEMLTTLVCVYLFVYICVCVRVRAEKYICF